MVRSRFGEVFPAFAYLLCKALKGSFLTIFCVPFCAPLYNYIFTCSVVKCFRMLTIFLSCQPCQTGCRMGFLHAIL